MKLSIVPRVKKGCALSGLHVLGRRPHRLVPLTSFCPKKSVTTLLSPSGLWRVARWISRDLGRRSGPGVAYYGTSSNVPTRLLRFGVWERFCAIEGACLPKTQRARELQQDDYIHQNIFLAWTSSWYNVPVVCCLMETAVYCGEAYPAHRRQSEPVTRALKQLGKRRDLRSSRF